MSRSLTGVWSCRVRLGPPGCFYLGSLGSQAGFYHLFTSLFLSARLYLLRARTGLVNLLIFSHQHKACYTVDDGESALTEQMNE